MRRKIGDIEMTALSDGPLPATLDTLLDFDRDEAQRLLGKPAGTPFFLPVNSYLLKLGGQMGADRHRLRADRRPRTWAVAQSAARGRRRAGSDRRCDPHTHPPGPRHGSGRCEGRRDLSQCRTDRARGGSEFLARPGSRGGRDRAHSPQYRQGAPRHRALSRAHAHRPRRRGAARRVGGAVARPYARPHRLGRAFRPRERADLGRRRAHPGDPGGAAGSGVRIRRRPAGRAGDTPAHLRHGFCRPAMRRRCSSRLSGHRHYRADEARTTGSSRARNDNA